MKDQASKQAEEETLVTELKDTKEKDDEKAEEEEENDAEEQQERQADIVEEKEVERQMIGQENSDHQYSSGDYKHQAKESLEDQSKMEGREEEEEEGEEEAMVVKERQKEEKGNLSEVKLFISN